MDSPHQKMELPISGKTYKHHTSGRYVVICLCEETTNARKGNSGGVIYVSLTYGKIKHRDLSEFIEEVPWPDGIMRPRFVLEESLE